MNCPACDTRLIDGTGSIYVCCDDCGSIIATRSITDLIETHNDSPDQRNTDKLHQVRLDRAEKAMDGVPIDNVIDFGCGKSQDFTRYLKNIDYIRVTPIDIDTPIQLDDLIHEHSLYDVCFMVEVIEHLKSPSYELSIIRQALRPDGVVYIETTFADSIESLPHPYVDPKIGHCTILSKKGLTLLAKEIGYLVEFLNDNVAILKKAG